MRGLDLPRGGARAFLVRLFPAYLMATAVVWALGDLPARALAPLFAAEVRLLSPGAQVRSFAVAGGSYQLRVTLPRSSGPARVATLALGTNSIQVYSVVMLALLASWPGLNRRARVRLATTSVPMLALASSLDVPWFLTEATSQASGTPPSQAMALWTFTLSNGGRQFLALLAFFCSLSVSSLLWAPPPLEVRRSKRPR